MAVVPTGDAVDGSGVCSRPVAREPQLDHDRGGRGAGGSGGCGGVVGPDDRRCDGRRSPCPWGSRRRGGQEESGIEVPTRSGSIEDAIEHRARPVVVTIPSLGVTAPVGAASVEPLSGQLAIPPDAASVVWYRHGPSPGQDGSAVLAGHVDWNGRQGAFFALGTLPPGAEFSIGYDDDTTRRFVVQARRSYPKPELPVQELFAPSGEPRLTLVTCGGSFDRATRHYRDNVVVVATPVT